MESGFENIGIFKEISSFFYNLRTTISERLEDAVDDDMFKKFKIGKIEGCYDKISGNFK
ncbi:MAG: hypothetical protein GY714_08130 [Desulfobacterales bacterium]|nr:hypothetical protein [Desulfobacterales bacterium]